MAIAERIFATLYTLSHRPKPEKGAAMVEYALLVAGMALVVVAAVAAFGTKITAIIDSIDIPT